MGLGVGSVKSHVERGCMKTYKRKGGILELWEDHSHIPTDKELKTVQDRLDKQLNHEHMWTFDGTGDSERVCVRCDKKQTAEWKDT